MVISTHGDTSVAYTTYTFGYAGFNALGSVSVGNRTLISNTMNNQINGVAPNKWEQYKIVAKGALDYTYNQMTNEILFWIGS